MTSLQKINLKKYLFVVCFVVLIIIMFSCGYKAANFFKFYNFVTKPVISNTSVTQLPSVPGQSIKWVKSVKLSSITQKGHFLTIPKNSINIKISTSTPDQKIEGPVKNIDRQELVKQAKENSQSEALYWTPFFRHQSC